MGLSAMINSIVFGVGSTITIVVVALLLDPATALPSWLGLLLSGVFCVIMWITLTPFRRLTALVTGVDPMADTRRSYERMKDTTLGLIGRVASTAAGSKVGTQDIAGDVADTLRDAQDGAEDAPTRPEAFSRPTSPADAHALPERVYDLHILPEPSPANPAATPRAAITMVAHPTSPAGHGAEQPATAPEALAVAPQDADPQAPLNGRVAELPAGPSRAQAPRSAPQADQSEPSVWQAMPEAETSAAHTPLQRIDPVVDENGEDVFVIYTPEEGWGTTSAAGIGTEQGDA